MAVGIHIVSGIAVAAVGAGVGGVAAVLAVGSNGLSLVAVTQGSDGLGGGFAAVGTGGGDGTGLLADSGNGHGLVVVAQGSHHIVHIAVTADGAGVGGVAALFTGGGSDNSLVVVGHGCVKGQTQCIGTVGLVVHGVVAAGACTPGIFQVFVQDGHGAVSQLGQAGVHEGVIVGGDADGVCPGHGVVAVDQAHKDLAVQTVAGAALVGACFAGASGAGDQDDLLAVGGLGVGDGGDLAVGVGIDAGVHGGAPGAGAHVVVHIAQVGSAVAEEEPQSAVGQLNHCGLGGPVVVELAGALPVHTVGGVDEAHALGVAGGAVVAMVAVNGEHDDAAAGHQATAGSNQADQLGGGLQVQQGGLGPGGAGVGGLGQIQEAGTDNLIGRIGEEQVGAGSVRASDVEVAIHGVAGDLGAGGGVDLAVLQVVAVGGMVVAAEQKAAVAVKANSGLGSGVAAAVQRDAVGIQVHQHVDGVVCGDGQGGVDEGGGAGAVVAVAVIAQVVGEGVVPGGTVVVGTGDDGIQAAAVIGGVPPGVCRGHQSAVAQGGQSRDAEAGAAAGALDEG